MIFSISVVFNEAVAAAAAAATLLLFVNKEVDHDPAQLH
jgi:hypothetical protein